MNAREATARYLRPDLFDRADLIVQTFAEYPTWLRFGYVIEAIGDAVQRAYDRADEVIAIADADLRAAASTVADARLPPVHWTSDDKYDRHPKTAAAWDWANDRADGAAIDASIRRLQFNSDFADPRAPDQLTLALRLDIIRVLGQLTWKEAQSESRAEKIKRLEAVLDCPAGDAQSALTWLAQNQNCELSYDYGDADDDGKGWCVHRVNGGRNDREWTLIGRGATPEAAILSAIASDAKGKVS